MLEETLEKLFNRKGAGFELPAIGSAILKGDLRTFQTAAIIKSQQAAIAEGHAMNIRSQILESGLPIPDRFAMHDPLLHPDLGRDLVEEFQFFQTASEGSPNNLERARTGRKKPGRAGSQVCPSECNPPSGAR